MTGFNKTLDVNLEHTGLEYTHNQSRNHQQFFFFFFCGKEEIQKEVSSPMIPVAAALLSVLSFVRSSMPSKLGLPLLLMMLVQKSW